MNFGLENFLPATLYATFWIALLASMLWRPVVGVYYLIPLIPAQTIRDRLNEFPLGSNVIVLVLLAITIGLLRQKPSPFWKNVWTIPVGLYVTYTFLSLCVGSLYLGRTFPFSLDDPRLQDWRNYVTMLLIVLLVAAAVTTTREMKIVIVLMCIAIFFVDRSNWSTVSNRDFSEYSADLRDEGAMGYAGANGMAAFQAQTAAFLLVMGGAFRRNRLGRLAVYVVSIFSTVCLLYSLSRGAYVAFLAGWLFLGLVKYRSLLVLLVVFGLSWTALVPPAVEQRVNMTYDEDSQELDHSAQTRVGLWEEAFDLFGTNPVTGTGFDTYAYLDHVGSYRDTHNIYVKVLVETGVLGALLFGWLLWRSFWGGWRLFRLAKDPFHVALGLGLAVWMICTMAANCFGDRWTYLQVNGYLWVVCGLVARAFIIEQRERGSEIEASEFEGARDIEELSPELAPGV